MDSGYIAWFLEDDLTLLAMRIRKAAAHCGLRRRTRRPVSERTDVIRFPRREEDEIASAISRLKGRHAGGVSKKRDIAV
jgi:hypothetical protein